MKRLIARVLRWSVVAALAAAPAAPVLAQSAIKVVVNDQAITSFEIGQRAKLLQLTTRAPNATSIATQELIDDTLKLQEAKRMKIAVSNQEVDAAFAQIAERVKLSPDKLAAALKQSGVGAETLKLRIRAQIAWSKLVRMRFNRQTTVSEQDVIAALQAKPEAKERKTLQFELTQVTIVVPAKANAAEVSRRQKEAESLRGRFTSCTDGLDFARSLPEVVVKPLGRRLESDLGPALTKILEETPVGRLTAPERDDSGFQLIAVCDKKVLDSDAAARREVEDELMTAEGDIASRRYLRDVKANAVIEYR